MGDTSKLYKWINSQVDILHAEGVIWSTIYGLSEEQKKEFLSLYTQECEHPRYKIRKLCGLAGESVSTILNLRDWLKNKDNTPGVEEKAYLIEMLECAKDMSITIGIPTGICSDLVSTLEKLPDHADMPIGYSIHFHW